MSKENLSCATESEPQTQGSSAGSFEVTEDERLLCARTNMLRLLGGDELSKELVSQLLEPVSDNRAQFECPVPICSVLYEIDMEDGSEKRLGDCAVVMAGIMKAASGRSQGLSFTEFVQTPLGKRTIK